METKKALSLIGEVIDETVADIEDTPLNRIVAQLAAVKMFHKLQDIEHKRSGTGITMTKDELLAEMATKLPSGVIDGLRKCNTIDEMVLILPGAIGREMVTLLKGAGLEE